ncbi:Hypothetical_protein [Hexamita inflata]|uniref:Hypothetical_protein n=1 Tax=Hexamita inflata TaxID=28002 RepID=A0AA86V6W2_9EUKA|nr:Hypothetical protein HINF_LOCUS66212 [Hexamita inflata]
MYLYIQLTLNKCTTDICCFKANLSEHLVQGECQSCPELYDYDKQQCTTCQALYGEWSYYLKGDCYCGGGSVGKNAYCDDCWQRRMIVYNNQCVTQCVTLLKWNILHIYAQNLNVRAPIFSTPQQMQLESQSLQL